MSGKKHFDGVIAALGTGAVWCLFWWWSAWLFEVVIETPGYAAIMLFSVVVMIATYAITTNEL